MPNADAATERLIAWCEAQIPLQQEKMRGAQQVVTIYATPTTQGAVIGSDSEEARFRSECANHFWQLADLLRRQADALAAARAENERLRAAYGAACAYIDVNVCDNDTTAEMWQKWQAFDAARRALAAQEGTR